MLEIKSFRLFFKNTFSITSHVHPMNEWKEGDMQRDYSLIFNKTLSFKFLMHATADIGIILIICIPQWMDMHLATWKKETF